MKNKKSLFAIAGLAAVLAVGGSIAYFNQTLTAENNFATSKFESSLVETFTPDLNWQPGTETTKEVSVKNTGDYDMIARVSWKETWTRKGDSQQSFETITSKDSGTSAVIKNYTPNTKWIAGGDGHWYYTDVLAAKNGVSDKFLDSVKLKDEANMGSYITTYTYFKAGNKIGEAITTPWTAAEMKAKGVTSQEIASTLNPNDSGYANAQYKLVITVETMQATKAAGAEWSKEAKLTDETVKAFLDALAVK